MSYDTDHISTEVCPCGKGTCKVTLHSNEWNQTNESWEMLCADCRKNYILDPITRYDSGRGYRSYTWITKQEFRARNEKRKIKKKAVSLAKKRYLKLWVEGFRGLSKKNIWEKLPKSPEGYPALGTFYAHVKYHGSIEDYLSSRFEMDIENIFPQSLKDDEIEKMLLSAR